ncbi:hypothetical protein CkaCkLH20_00911 [Colletotrichum karsti]|uniref:O-methyltransferase C-terminal domain-containing protein n=1 Tax=Colletotrichum karsti TaxID=1095194 RepID=A0A9P6IFH5_9PEZI|nr:uncharacterized protein CkaCkLH20_00911 [Colletotrichum karsti]KAF9881765.1 hypothetical protein CkaCkLH20_00911 [Colletotrichum karsti]
MTVAKLSEAAGAREDRLRPVMRLLYNNGLFTYDASNDTYTNNARSDLLRSDHWTQWHTWVELYATEFYDMARGIPDSLLSGATRTAAQINYDTDDSIFAYFEKRGWLPRVHRAFSASQVAQAPGILTDYPWHEIGDKTVLDVGGGGGALMASLLREHPKMRGGILDMAAVIDHTGPFFHSPDGQYADVGSRISPENLVAGDFLTGPLPRHEVYVIKWCLHNWLDPEVIQILRNIRESIVPGDQSRLVVMDAVLQDGAMGRLAQYGDVQMLMTAKGRERTAEDWQQVAKASGWNIHKIYPLRNAWKYLDWKHPIYGENGDKVGIPSCPYVWPNGQGDIAKFLKGVENSAAWEKQHGRMYRIWSGMKPEIVLTQPHHLQTVFRDSDKHSKAPANNSGFYMNRLLGECVGLLSGPDWRSVRAVAEPPFQRAAPIVGMYEAVASGNISEEQLLQTLDESLFANLDVTMGGLSWVPVFLAAHQNAQSRLRTEIEREATSPETLHRYLDNSRSTYLACCVIESSRLRPLAAFSVPQAAPTPRRLEVSPGLTYVVPEGTSFVVDTYALNVRNEAWAPDNESFRPERFLNSNEKDARDRRYLFWRYGFGPRQCMGRHAADLIIRTTVAHLVRNYQLDLLSPEDHLDGSSWARNQECWITHPSLNLRCTRRILENK